MGEEVGEEVEGMMYRELLAVDYNFQLHSMEESKAASKEITWQPSATVVLELAITFADVTLCTAKIKAEY